MFGGGDVGSADTSGIDFANREAVEESVSDNGAVTLAWEGGSGEAVVLQQAADPGFSQPVIRYEGADSGSVVTGLPEGVHYFRIGLVGSQEWSEPIRVEVKFFERTTLAILLTIGGVVVIATVGAIVTGAVRSRGEKGELV